AFSISCPTTLTDRIRGTRAAFFETKSASGGDVAEHLCRSVGPPHFEGVDLGGVSKPEGQRFLGGRQIRRAAGPPLLQRIRSDSGGHTGPDGVAVGFSGSKELDPDRLLRPVEAVEIYPGRTAVFDHDDIEIAVAVEIRIGGAAADERRRHFACV